METREMAQGLGGKTWGKESLAISEHKREDDIKEIGWQAVDLIDLVQRYEKLTGNCENCGDFSVV